VASIPSLWMSRRRPFVGRRGFTLIELLTVMTVIGIMATIAMPYLRVSPHRKVRAAGQDVVRYLEVARTRALATKKKIRITFDVSRGEYAAYLDHDGNGVYTQSAQEWQEAGIGPRQLPSGLLFGRGSAPEIPEYPGAGAVTFANDRLEFNNRGMTLPFGIRGAVYITYRDDPTAVSAISISGSASFKAWEYRDGAWQ
jgi:prepilin-type N-terminal cleavage/methylation domain-containing protein